MIEMGMQKAMAEWDADVLYDEDKQTIRPPKKDDGDPPGFYEKISAKCEFWRQRWEEDEGLPLDLSTDMKARLARHRYWLLYYKNDTIHPLDAEDIHRCIH